MHPPKPPTTLRYGMIARYIRKSLGLDRIEWFVDDISRHLDDHALTKNDIHKIASIIDQKAAAAANLDK